MARQKRMSIGPDDFYLDLLLFHRPLRTLVAVELKLGRFDASDKGQMELYLRWLDKHERQPHENPPLGLILCADKNEEQVGRWVTADAMVFGVARVSVPRKIREGHVLPLYVFPPNLLNTSRIMRKTSDFFGARPTGKQRVVLQSPRFYAQSPNDGLDATTEWLDQLPPIPKFFWRAKTQSLRRGLRVATPRGPPRAIHSTYTRVRRDRSTAYAGRVGATRIGHASRGTVEPRARRKPAATPSSPYLFPT